jgi:hypothetical protein
MCIMLSKTGLPVLTFYMRAELPLPLFVYPLQTRILGGRLMGVKENVKSRLKFNILLYTLMPIFMKRRTFIKKSSLNALSISAFIQNKS